MILPKVPAPKFRVELYINAHGHYGLRRVCVANRRIVGTAESNGLSTPANVLKSIAVNNWGDAAVRAMQPANSGHAAQKAFKSLMVHLRNKGVIHSVGEEK